MTVILLVVVFINLLLGFLAITQNSKSWNSRFFALLSFLAAVWTFTNFITGPYPTQFWVKTTYASGALVISAGVSWAFVFVDKKFTLKKVFLPLLVGIVFMFASYVPGFIAEDFGEIYPGGAFVGIPGIGLALYALYFILSMSVILYNFGKQYRIETNTKLKNQLHHIILGTIGIFIFSLLTSFLFPLFSLHQFSGFDSVGFLIFLSLISYSIIQYRLLDIRVIATELLTFAIWIFLLIRTLLSGGLQEIIVNGAIFVAVIVFGILLIRSVIKEVEQKEELARLNKEIEKAYEVEKKAKGELEKLDAAKTQFIMATQHHLRTPLTAIQGYLDLLLTGTYGKVSQKVANTLGKLQISTKRLMRIVNEILDISQFQLGKEVVHLEPNVDVGELIKEMEEELKFQAESRNLYFRIMKSGPLPTIKADAEKLKVALFNIADNAIKYTQKGGITVEIHQTDSMVQIAIKDTGMGMSKTTVDNLFKGYFERGGEAEKAFKMGRGIGMYITFQIIKAHKGKLYAESEGEGKGSAFFVELPVG